MRFVRETMRAVGANGTDRMRAVWGMGIALVMIAAVSPYPVMGIVTADEIPHRIHNTVGALQYLPLWAVPVLVLTFHADRLGAWRIALASSVAMAGVGVWSGDLIESLSWMPLATLLVLWPGRHSWRPELPLPGMIVPGAATIVTCWVAVSQSPHLVDLQRLDMGDSHSVRFHFSGMAAAYISLALCAMVITLYRVGRLLRVVVGVSVVVAGACSLAWPDYESALGGRQAWALVAAGTALVSSAVHRSMNSTS